MKKRINITLSPDAVLVLKQYAQDHHTTVSATIELMVWNVFDKKIDNVPGQLKLKGID